MKAEIIAIGDELATGQRLDTNSQWLSRELGLLGVVVSGHTTVPDTIEDAVRAFREARQRADVVVATGGLGPTADDLTREVLARVAGEPLELVPEALQRSRRCLPRGAAR
jgi:Predicted nucleotide-utilizing enzyme related to molybdopterin-biosynthesis enzyme MoeA